MSFPISVQPMHLVDVAAGPIRIMLLSEEVFASVPIGKRDIMTGSDPGGLSDGFVGHLTVTTFWTALRLRVKYTMPQVEHGDAQNQTNKTFLP